VKGEIKTVAIPVPKKQEPQGKFIARCVSALAGEGDRYTNEQRTAICYSQWKKRKKGETMKPRNETAELTPISEVGTTGVIAGHYEEVPPLPKDMPKPTSYIETLEEELKSP